MKDEDLKAKGLTDEQIAFVMAENGKELKKLQKESEKMIAEKDAWQEKAQTAEETLKRFEGIDPEKIQSELDGWKQKAEDAEKNAQAQIYERDFNDALKTEFEGIKFSSEAAKRDVMSQVKAAELKLKDGKILGLNDLMDQIREKDATAFVDETQEHANNNAARFTDAAGKGNTSGRKYTMSEIMKMKNENPELDIKQYMTTE